jgi:GT2 family glycosyltransferase
MEGDDRVGAVTCSLTDAAGKFQEAQGDRFPTLLTTVNQYLFLNRFFGDRFFPGVYLVRRPAARRTVEWISGAVMMFRRAAVPGGVFFDEAFFLYGEDMDASMRLRRAGWTLLFLADVVAVHHVKASTGRSPEAIYRMQVVNPLVCIRRHCRRWEYPFIKGVIGLGYLLRAAAYGVKGVIFRDAVALRRAARQWSYFRCLGGV